MEVVPVMKGSSEDVTVLRRQSEQGQDESIRAVFKEILVLMQDE